MPNEFLLIAGMAIITFSIRYVVLAASSKITLSPKLTQLLQYIPPAVLTAIVVPAVLIPEGNELLLTVENPRLIGAIAAVLISYWTNNLLLAIGIGMLTFFVANVLLLSGSI